MMQTNIFFGSVVLFFLLLEYPNSLYFILSILKFVKSQSNKEERLLEEVFYLYHKYKRQIINKIANKIANKINGNHFKEKEIELVEDKKEIVETKNKPIQRYEDKYLDKIRELPSEYVFSKEEKEREEKMNVEYLNNAINSLISNKNRIMVQLNNLQQELYDMENIEFNENDKKKTYDEDGDEVPSFEETIKAKKTIYEEQIEELETKLNSLNKKEIHEEIIRKEVFDIITNERLSKLKNNFIIEKTPLGNVLMFYNNDKKTFQYYSDNSIPYRFLEVVGRKYVLTFNCRYLYVDMEEELKKSESKLEMNKNILQKQQDLELKNENDNTTCSTETSNKKNVFAKFKSYNKDAGSGRVNKAPPPKNSIPNNKIKTEPDNEKILLKERANHYTCEGKIANFDILKKIDKKQINKKYAMSFADFKKNQINKK